MTIIILQDFKNIEKLINKVFGCNTWRTQELEEEDRHKGSFQEGWPPVRNPLKSY